MKNKKEAILSLSDIVKTYQLGSQSIPVLKGIDMTVEQGEYISIMGPSGSGKSTLLNIIGCLDIPTSGKYVLNGTSVAKMTEDELADVRSKELGFIFQSFHLIPQITVFENVMVPQLYTGEESQERAMEVLKMVGMEDRIKHLPSELSGGQRQRVAIARALINNPDVILADEPTGNLDSKTGSAIMDFIAELQEKGKTIVMVTHDDDLAAETDRIIQLLDGKTV